MNHEADRGVSPCYFPHLPDCHAAEIGGGCFPPHKYSLWSNSIWTWCWHLHMHCRDQPAFGSRASPSLQAEGMTCCSPLPGKLLYPALVSPYLSWLPSSSSLLALCTAWFTQSPSKADTERDGAHRQPFSLMLGGIPLSLPFCPHACALWVTRSSCCLGVHMCVRTAFRCAVIRTLSKD